jgi:hypothetical protein
LLKCGLWEETMPSRFQRSGADQGANMFMAPGVALALWNPFLTGALTGNTQAFGEFGTIAREWQNFVNRRLKEDVALFQRLGRSAKPDEILEAYAEFWRKAGEDYGEEITTMTKLMTEITTKAAVTAQSAIEDANTRLSQREAA